MKNMENAGLDFFREKDFMPHGQCYLWESPLVWIHALGDGLLFIVYVILGVLASYFTIKRKNLPFRWIFWSFPGFIFTCATTHLMGFITIWEPIYWMSGSIKVITLVVSTFTVYAVFRFMPQILQIPTTDEMKEVNKQLTLTNKELEAFSYSVSHDLRAPLRGIDGFSQALQDDCVEKLNDEEKEYLNEIRSCTSEMSVLIDELLSLSRLSRQELVTERVDLSEIVKKQIDSLKNDFPERNVEVHIHENITVDGDRALLTTVMQNLIENAWKFTGKTSKAFIEFGISQEKDGTAYTKG
ncbi:MAG: hypothetical protein HQK84_06360 [Nitrospinae bacterium]|nr:hypothetical protein [Nitrospinota bacterium]